MSAKSHAILTIPEIVAAYRPDKSSPSDTLVQIYNDSLLSLPLFENIGDFIQWLLDAKQAEQKLGLSDQMSDNLRQTLMLGVITKLEPARTKVFGDWIGMTPKDWGTFLIKTVFEKNIIDCPENAATFIRLVTLFQLPDCSS